MKKIAICLHGDSSSWSPSIEKSFLNNIYYPLEPNKPDIFISNYDHNSNQKFIMKDKQMNIFKPVIKISHNYDIFKYQAEEECKNKIPDYKIYPLTVETLMTTKKINLLFKDLIDYEKKNNITYDIIMFATFNVNYKKPISIDNTTTDKNNIYVFSFNNDLQPSDKVVFGYRKPILNIFISRYDNIFKINNEFIHFKCPTNNPTQLLRYSYIKAGLIDYKWITLNNQATLI
jgi:hypothetical protein